MAFGQAAFDHGWTKGMGPGRADLEDEKEHRSSSPSEPVGGRSMSSRTQGLVDAHAVRY